MSPTRGRDLNQTQLIEEVAAQLNWPEEDARKAVRAFVDTVARTMASGHNVTITNFGRFESYRYGARKVRNPQTGETWRARDHQRPRFKPSRRLVQVVRRRGGSIRKLPKGTLEVTR